MIIVFATIYEMIFILHGTSAHTNAKVLPFKKKLMAIFEIVLTKYIKFNFR